MLYVRLPLNWVSRSFGLASFCCTLPTVCLCVWEAYQLLLCLLSSVLVTVTVATFWSSVASHFNATSCALTAR